MENAGPYVGMVMVQIAQVGLMIAAKIAMSNGMTSFTFVCYSNALSTLILLPLSFSCTDLLVLRFSSLSFVDFFAWLYWVLGADIRIHWTSVCPCITLHYNIEPHPGFQFRFAVIFRMEKFNYKSSSTMAKCIGTVITVIGAIIMTVYQGPPILGSPNDDAFSNFHTLITTSSSAWLIGGLILTIDCMVSAFFIITQAVVLRKCPAELILMLFYSCFIAILSGTVSLIVEKDFSAWSLKPKMRLIPIIYSGIFGNAFQVSIIMWCVRRRGPVFASLFHPLGVIFAIALGIIILGEAFYLGSLVGSIVTVVGFYCVIWGKAKETKMNKEGPKSLESNGKRVPLLQNIVEDEIVIA